MSLKPEQVTQVQALAVQAMAGILLRAMVSDVMEFDPSVTMAGVTIRADDVDGSLTATCDLMDETGAVVGGFTL